MWAGDHDGGRGVRMRQTVRDFTTLWFGIEHSPSRPVDEVTRVEVELVLGEVYGLAEVAHPPLVSAAFTREKDA